MINKAICLILMLSSSHLLAADAPPTEVGAGEIAGVVTDDSGKPIEGALIDAWTWYAGNETKTDTDGRFHLKKLRTDRKVELRISKEGFAPWYEVQQETGIAELKVELNNKTCFEGTVLAPDGKPVPNALVRADCGPKISDGRLHIINVWSETKADASGHYKLFAAPDTYMLETRIPEIGVSRFQVSIDPGQAVSQDIQLAQGIRFVVKCIDGDAQVPVPDVKVNVGRHKGMTAISDASGNAVFEHMPDGSYEFGVSCKGYVKWWSADSKKENMRTRPQNLALRWEDIEFELNPDMEPVTVELEKGITITGHVLDPESKPVAGAIVATVKTGWGDSIDSTKRFTTKTDAEGAFTTILPASGDDHYNLVAHDGEYDKWRTWANGVSEPMQTKPGENVNDVTIKLTRPATIKGKVVFAPDNPAADKWVRVMSADDLDSRYAAPETHTDKDGNFELKFVRPGDVLVQVEPFYMKDDNGRMSPITGVQVNVSENEVKEDVVVTTNR